MRIRREVRVVPSRPRRAVRRRSREASDRSGRESKRTGRGMGAVGGEVLGVVSRQTYR